MKNDMLLALSRQKCKGGARREESELLHSSCFTPNASLSGKIGDSRGHCRRGGEGSYIDAVGATMRQMLQAEHHSNKGANLLGAG